LKSDAKIKAAHLACFEHLPRNTGMVQKGVKTQKMSQNPQQKSKLHT
jgi:hypothetical protein